MKKKPEPEPSESMITEGYTAGQAAVIMARNSQRAVSPDLVKKLGQLGVIRYIVINSRLKLYNKEDVDAYIVEDRGVKAGRAARTRTIAKEEKDAA